MLVNGQPNAFLAGMKRHRPVPLSPMWSGQTIVAISLLVLTAALGIANENTGMLRGTVVAVESDGAKSAIPAATVTLAGPNVSKKVTADDGGAYSFGDVPPGRYEIEAVAAGLRGSAPVDVAAGEGADVVIVMAIEALKESVTVSGNAEPVTLADPQPQAAITRSTILNAPMRDDRADTLLPLIPGVVRGPDGLINMKGRPFLSSRLVSQQRERHRSCDGQPGHEPSD